MGDYSVAAVILVAEVYKVHGTREYCGLVSPIGFVNERESCVEFWVRV